MFIGLIADCLPMRMAGAKANLYIYVVIASCGDERLNVTIITGLNMA